MIANDGVSNESSSSPNERKKSRRYILELIVAGITYAALINVRLRFVDHVEGAARIFVAVLPIVGVLLMALAMVRYVLGADEFQRQTIVVSGAWAALICGIVTMTLGFLEYAGVGPINMTFVLPIIVVIFGIAMLIVRQRS